MANIITVDTLTTNEVEGTGVFDELMRSVKAHLEDQRTKGYITEVNYSQVYLGALTAVLQESSRFLLASEEQYIKNQLTELQVKAGVQQELILKEDLKLKKLEVINAQRMECKTRAEILLLEEQVIQIKQATYNSTLEAGALVNRDLKVQEEISLVRARTKTEYAQTADTIDATSIGGVIGAQTVLYRNQAEGFVRTSEQAAARILADNFAVQATTGTVPAWSAAGFTNAHSKTLMDQLVTGSSKGYSAGSVGVNTNQSTPVKLTENVLVKDLTPCTSSTPIPK